MLNGHNHKHAMRCLLFRRELHVTEFDQNSYVCGSKLVIAPREATVHAFHRSEGFLVYLVLTKPAGSSKTARRAATDAGECLEKQVFP